MALINCPECGKQFSDRAPACPDCGCPTNEVWTRTTISHFDDVFICNKVMEALSGGAIKEAKKIISQQENVLFASVLNVSTIPVSGKLSDSFSVKGKVSGVLAITDKRVVFVNSKLGIGDTKQILKEHITSVDTKKSLLNCPVRIQGLTEMFVIDCDSETQSRILNALRH